MAIATTRQIGSECHLVSELCTSSRPLHDFVTDVNDALRRCIRQHYTVHRPLNDPGHRRPEERRRVGLEDSGLRPKGLFQAHELN